MVKKIGLILGSLRQDSNSQKIADSLKELFPADVELTQIEISDLPLYNPDYDEEGGQLPESYTRYRNQVKEQDGLIFIVAEYNRGLTAALKNAVDVASRPLGDGAMGGKPALIASHSTGNVSGFGVNHQLRQSLVFLDIPVLAKPESYLAQAHTLFGEDNKLNNEGTKNFLQTVVNTYLTFANRFVD
ncbi:NAD(P)H-dependent oxidoreductase [Streptococcus sp. X16XC17]|uniref:NADPH-dependent FMN reductase n=1 Tax=unclassified Streptococcus TaxID=2608887 RepID=UPI00066FECCA|nr:MULTISPECIES: NAD(P)H-dependent oxidoreductase [unclassified Streptococcus]TCD46245.1 NAD(P)H-dependent oxidoreductase [Streptococcus sp. X16XC17]